MKRSFNLFQFLGSGATGAVVKPGMDENLTTAGASSTSCDGVSGCAYCWEGKGQTSWRLPLTNRLDTYQWIGSSSWNEFSNICDLLIILNDE